MPTLKRLRFVRHMTFKEVYARAQIDELKSKIKLNKAMLNEGKVNPESWRAKWLEEVKGYKWAICAWKKLLTQKRKPSGTQCPFCNTEMEVLLVGSLPNEIPSLLMCPMCKAHKHRYKSSLGFVESQYRYTNIAI